MHASARPVFGHFFARARAALVLFVIDVYNHIKGLAFHAAAA